MEVGACVCTGKERSVNAVWTKGTQRVTDVNVGIQRQASERKKKTVFSW